MCIRDRSGAVWLDPNKTSPFEFYQYWRNIDDADVINCLRKMTFLPLEQIDEMSKWKDEMCIRDRLGGPLRLPHELHLGHPRGL